jgi:hypothetical protein
MWRAGVWIFNTLTGDCIPLHVADPLRDQMPSIVTSHVVGGPPLVALCLYGRVVITNRSRSELAEPIPIPGPFVRLAQFSRDGKQLMTLSGSSWTACDTIMISSLNTIASAPDTTVVTDVSSPAPEWLAELADAVSRQQPDDSISFWTVEKLRLKFAKVERSTPYDIVWNRFFSN